MAKVLPDIKILVKGGPKQYKTHPQARGAPRLYHQLFHLFRRTQKLAQQPNADAFTIAMSDELKRVIDALSVYDRTS
jgi:hypothetical protein